MVVLERVRQAIAPDGSASTADDTIELDQPDARPSSRPRAPPPGCAPSRGAVIGETDAHVGSTVVMLRG